MPEGPSIIIAKNAAKHFIGKKVIAAAGNAKIDVSRLENKKLVDIKTWGKHLLLCFDGFTVRIHFLLFGTYFINQTKNALLRLGLTFKNGEFNIYTAAVTVLEGNVADHYDFTADVMNDTWNPASAKAKLADVPNKQVCDALLEQDIFSGVGNIIKNEVLYRVHVHPESLVGSIQPDVLDAVVTEARNYSFDFLHWKEKDELKKHWLAHSKKVCKRCDLPLYKEYTGVKKRRSFFCTNCQVLYKE
ncbi:endonuclease [Flavobacterium subsaxonicum]|uniref:Endonuclease n=1 Tax=Flavobacterium subsaxonicum WB 4.1-42 = DSM 21790 TaxID=1121898 RepID=A0A0A2MS31_9FLAO|nr:endonuclease [Flavobacterium subsaxonicum]KGO94401.1 endonuclease [Flavobacterium subsaxonicum WB 4.1-42 = DSM 21790]